MGRVPKGRQVAAVELGHRLVVGARLAREEHEGDVGPQVLLDPARTPNSAGIAVQQDLEHQCGVIGRHAPRFVVGGEEGREIEALHKIADEGRQAVGFDPIANRRRHQQEAVLVVWPEGLGAHARFSHA